MTQKEIVRWEHIEAYRLGQLDEIPEAIRPLVKEKVDHMNKANALKGKKVDVKEVDIHD